MSPHKVGGMGRKPPSGRRPSPSRSPLKARNLPRIPEDPNKEMERDAITSVSGDPSYVEALTKELQNTKVEN